MKKAVILLFFLFIQCEVKALPSQHPREKEAETLLSRLYKDSEQRNFTTMNEKMQWFSKIFLGKPYFLGALGEGIQARYDQFPLYRTDSFDCETYVTTVLSLALATNVQGFKQCMRALHYENGKVAFIRRYHFTELGWNQNNQRRGILKDITRTIKDSSNKPVFLTAKAYINKSQWIHQISKDRIRLYKENETKQEARLVELRGKSNMVKNGFSYLPYVPLKVLFNAKGEPQKNIFKQIPNGAIIEIVRPNWDLEKQIGTRLNISHLGFVFWDNGILYFREASLLLGKVVDVPLEDYLHDALPSPTIKGINIQTVVAERPGVNFCSER